MAVTIYKSTDASAPVLTGQVGSLITLLDAVLVNGYGAKVAAGWTKPFTGTNLAAYRMAVTGSGHYLRVDDNGPNTTAGAREAQARGAESMSAISTQTGPFPTTSQLGVSGIPIRKSATADATARSWKIVADDKTFYLFQRCGDFSGYTGFMFGDFFSLKAADAYRSMIIGRSVQNSNTDDVDRLNQLNLNTTTSALGNAATTIAGHYIPRAWNENATLGAQLVGKHGDGVKGSFVYNTGQLAGIVAYPNQPDNSLMLSQVWVHEDNGSTITVRGRLRGFWHMLHPVGVSINEGDTFAGTGPLAGKSFEVIGPTVDGLGKYVMETSNTWETN